MLTKIAFDLLNVSAEVHTKMISVLTFDKTFVNEKEPFLAKLVRTTEITSKRKWNDQHFARQLKNLVSFETGFTSSTSKP